MTSSRSRPRFSPLTARLPVAMLAALLLTACGTEDSAPEVAAGPDSLSQEEREADIYRATLTDWDFDRCPALTPPKALTPGERPTAVLRCGTSTELKKGDGEWRYRGTWRATAGLSDLVAALRLPPIERAEAETCIGIGLSPYYVVVEIDGAPRVVPAPERPCGQPPQELSDAYRALVWEEASSEPIERIRSEEAVRAGCEGRLDEIAFESYQVRSTPPVPSPLPTEGAFLVCSYRSVYPAEWPAAGWPTPKDEGWPEVNGLPLNGGTLDDAASERMRAALTDMEPARPCTTRHDGFAIVEIRTKITTEAVHVELDGCRRVLLPGNALRQASNDLMALIADAT